MNAIEFARIYNGDFRPVKSYKQPNCMFIKFYWWGRFVKIQRVYNGWIQEMLAATKHWQSDNQTMCTVSLTSCQLSSEMNPYLYLLVPLHVHFSSQENYITTFTIPVYGCSTLWPVAWQYGQWFIAEHNTHGTNTIMFSLCLQCMKVPYTIHSSAQYIPHYISLHPALQLENSHVKLYSKLW